MLYRVRTGPDSKIPYVLVQTWAEAADEVCADASLPRKELTPRMTWLSLFCSLIASVGDRIQLQTS